jgi:hypothetical protein
MVEKNQLANRQEKQVLHDEFANLHGQEGEALKRQHAAAGVSMYGRDNRYPHELVELAPDGRRFIVKRDGRDFIRIREVDA